MITDSDQESDVVVVHNSDEAFFKIRLWETSLRLSSPTRLVSASNQKLGAPSAEIKGPGYLSGKSP